VGEGLVFAIWLPYGPGTAISLAPDTVMAVGIRKRRFPLIGDDAGIWSYVRIEDVAAVTAAGVGHGQPGIYNVVDDNPAPVREWLPELARIVGGRATGTFPRKQAVRYAGEAAVVMATESSGASNAKAKRELGWTLGHSSWRQGGAAVYETAATSAARAGPANGERVGSCWR
jgi:nucleoside-diphosphate-sugar epimerase